MHRSGMLACVTAILVGCSSLSGVPERSVDPDAELRALAPYFAPGVLDEYNRKETAEEKRRYRDEVVWARLRGIDIHFNRFVRDIASENKKLNITTDSAIAVLGAAGSVSTVSSTQAILAAISATVAGVKSSIDKNAYYDSTVTALVAQMLANRQGVLVDIHAGMQRGIDTYPLTRALIDVERYFQAGTVAGAVTEINKQAGTIKSEADRELSIMLRSSFQRDSAGDLLRRFWKPDGKTIDSANEARLKAWIGENVPDSPSITSFIRGDRYAAWRERAIEDLAVTEEGP